MKVRKLLITLLLTLFGFMLFACVKPFKVSVENIKLITTENEKVDLNRVAKNQKLNFEIAIKPRTAFDKLFINDVDRTSLVKDNKFSLTITGNTSIKAVLKKLYEVKLGENITLQDSSVDLANVKDCQELAFNIAKQEGKIIQLLLINGVDKFDLVSDYQFKYTITEDTEFKVTYVENEKKFSVELDENVQAIDSSIDLSNVLVGSTLEFNINVKDGYKLTSLKVNNQEYLDHVKDYKFKYTIRDNTSIKAEYTKIHKVVLTDVLLERNQKVSEFETLDNTTETFIIPPKTGWAFKQLLINGKAVNPELKDNKFEYTITSDTIIVCEYYKIDKFYKLNLTDVELENKELDLNKIKADSNVNFLVNKKAGYKLTSLLINGKENINLVNDYKFSYTVSSELDIKAVYTKLYKLSFNQDDVEIITPNLNTDEILANTKISFKVINKTSKLISKVELNKQDITDQLVNNEYNFDINSDSEIKVSYINLYQVTTTDNVSLLDSNIDLNSVKANTKLTFKLNSINDHVFTKLLINNQDQTNIVEPNNEFSLTINENTDIIAEYRKLNKYKLTLENVELVDPTLDKDNIKENTTVQFRIKPVENQVFKELLINDQNKSDLIQDDIFSLTINEDTVIKAVYRLLDKFKLNLTGVELVDPSLDKDEILENSVVRFKYLNKSENKELDIIGDNDNSFNEIDNETFELTVKNELTVSYQLKEPKLYYNDQLVDGNNEVEEIYEQEKFSLEYSNFKPTKVEISSDQETELLEYEQAEDDHIILTIKKLTKLGANKITLKFYDNEEYTERAITFNVLTNDLYRDKLFIEELYNGYKAIEGKKDVVYHSNFDDVDGYLKYLIQFKEQINTYLPYIDYIGVANVADLGDPKKIKVYADIPLVGKLYLPQVLIDLINANKDAVEKGSKVSFLSAHFFDYGAWNELSDEDKTNLATNYNAMTDEWNKIKDLIKNFVDFVIEYNNAHPDKNARSVLENLPTYLTYFDELKQRRSQFDFLDKINKIRNLYIDKNFENNAAYQEFLNDGTNFEMKELLAEVKAEGAKNPKQTFDQINTENIELFGTELLNFFNEFYNKVLPLNDDKTAVDLDKVNQITEGIIHFEYYIIHYFNLLFKHEDILSTDAIATYPLSGKINPRELINNAYKGMFKCEDKPILARPNYPIKKFFESITAYNKRLAEYRAKFQEYKDLYNGAEHQAKLQAWLATNPYVAGEKLANTLNSFRNQDNINLVKSIVKPFVENITKLLVKDQDNNFVIINALKKRNEFLESLK